MKMKYVRKLIIGSTAIAFTAATLTTTTYAWLTMGYVSEITEFEFKADTRTGLQVSLDGKSFAQDITLAQLKSVIEKNTDNKSVYGNGTYSPVTLKQDSNGKVEFDSNGYPLMVKDHITEYTSAEKTTLNIPAEVDYKHDYQNAYAYNSTTNKYYSEDYLFFDVWFRITVDGKTNDTFDLYFKDTTDSTGTKVGISGHSVDLVLQNTLTTQTGTYGPYETDPDKQHIVVNPADAMRLAVRNQSTGDFTIYEENIGLGSSAIEGSTDPLHDKTKNAMYTLYNGLYPSAPLTAGAAPGDAYTTVTSTSTQACYSKDPIHTFTYDTTNNKYQDVRMTFIIWLEGWDADYFDGIADTSGMYDPNKMNVNLAFEAKLHS